MSHRSKKAKEIRMNAYRYIAVTVFVTTLCAVFVPNANAQLPIQKLRVTISEPLEVPSLVLPIGTYIFEAVENGRVTRVLNADESHIYATLLTQPQERREPVDSPVIALKEPQKGAVGRIDAWFFAGESIGSEFLYPETPGVDKSESKLGVFTGEAGHAVEMVAEDVVAVPEYLAVHAGHAVVGSSVATGRFFRANFLVN
jgi:hypothetical protein